VAVTGIGVPATGLGGVVGRGDGLPVAAGDAAGEGGGGGVVGFGEPEASGTVGAGPGVGSDGDG
jgi:hypothetical protein